MQLAVYETALTIGGPWGWALMMVAAAVDSALLGAILAPSTDGQKISGRKVTTRSAVEDASVVYGNTVVSGPIAFMDSSGSDNKFLHLVILLGMHEFEAIDYILLNDRPYDDFLNNQDEDVDLIHLTSSTSIAFAEIVSYNLTLTITDQFGAVTAGPTNFTGTVDSVISAINSNSNFNTKIVASPTTWVLNQGTTTDQEYSYSIATLTANTPEHVIGISGTITGQFKQWDESGDYLLSSGDFPIQPVYIHRSEAALLINSHLGTPNQTVDASLNSVFPVGWPSTSRLHEIPYLYARLGYDKDAFPSGMPNVRAIVRGKKLFDPRNLGNMDTNVQCVSINTDSVYGYKATIVLTNPAIIPQVGDSIYLSPNGDVSGNPKIYGEKFVIGVTPLGGNIYNVEIVKLHNFTTGTISLPSETYDVTLMEYGTNWALCVRDYLTNPSYGLGVLPSEIDDSFTIAAANISDEDVVTEWGTNKPTGTAIGTNTLRVNNDIAIHLKVGNTINITTNVGTYDTVITDKVGATLDSNRRYIPENLPVDLVLSDVYPGTVVGPVTINKVLNHARYTCNGSLSSNRSIVTNLEALMSCAMGNISYSQGKFRIHAGAYAGPATVTITKDDIYDVLEILPYKPKADTYNTIKGVYIDTTAEWQANDFPPYSSQVHIDEDNGEILEANLELSLVNDPFTAQRLAKIFLLKNRQSLTVKLVTSIAKFHLDIMDYINISLPELGWNPKEFRITNVELNEENKLVLSCVEDAPELYDWDYTVDQANIDFIPNTSLDYPHNIFSPTNLVVNTPDEFSVFLDSSGTLRSSVSISWDPATNTPNLKNYLVRVWDATTGNKTDYSVLKDSTEFTYEGYPGQRIFIGVYSVNAFGITSRTAVQAAAQLPTMYLGTLSIPSAITVVNKVGGFVEFNVDTPLTNTNVKYVIKYGVAGITWAGASKLHTGDLTNLPLVIPTDTFVAGTSYDFILKVIYPGRAPSTEVRTNISFTSTGIAYNTIEGLPTSLAEINISEGNKLTNVDINATSGTNLVVNGDAQNGDNTNFTSLTYTSGTDAKSGSGYFFTSTSNSFSFSNNAIPIDSSNIYYHEAWVKNSGSAQFYIGVQCLNKDKVHIPYAGAWTKLNTYATLFNSLDAGDTQIDIDVSSWDSIRKSNFITAFNQLSTAVVAQFGVNIDNTSHLPIVDDNNLVSIFGSTKPSLDQSNDALGFWSILFGSGASPVPAAKAKPAGSPMALSFSGATYNYNLVSGIVNSYTDWTKFSGTLTGENDPNTNPSASLFRYGTKYIKLYNAFNTTGTSITWKLDKVYFGLVEKTADSTKEALNRTVAPTAGGIVLGGTSSIKIGQTGYNTGTGAFLGFDGGIAKFSIGDAATTKGVKWDGTTLTVNGTLLSTSGIIGGWIIGNTTVSSTYGGTTISMTSGPTDADAGFLVANSTNSVKIGVDGLTGTDSILGTTFHIPTDGTPPTFYEGIIKNVEYQVYTGGVIVTTEFTGRPNTGVATGQDKGGVLVGSTGLLGFKSVTTDPELSFYLLNNGNMFVGDLGGSNITYTAGTGLFTITVKDTGGIDVKGTNAAIRIADDPTSLSYLNGSGVWIGRDGGISKFHVGDPTNESYIAFDGTDVLLGRETQLEGVDTYNDHGASYNLWLPGLFNSAFITGDVTVQGGFIRLQAGPSAATSAPNSTYSINDALAINDPNWNKLRAIKSRIRIGAVGSSYASSDAYAILVTGVYSATATSTRVCIGFRYDFNTGQLFGVTQAGGGSDSKVLIATMVPGTEAKVEAIMTSVSNVNFYVNDILTNSASVGVPFGPAYLSDYILRASIHETTIAAGERVYLDISSAKVLEGL